ncbi:MAG: signal transduction histidine kinase [Halothiobacillaceae bacterium]|nr:MAG: signal transduction histidine kinase [Halothiobacillaceae bacterium]
MFPPLSIFRPFSLAPSLDNLTTTLESADSPANGEVVRLKYETKRLNNQLVLLLTLYKLGNSQYQLDIADHDVGGFIDETTLAYRELLLQRGIHLEIDTPTNLVGYFDASLVAGVIHNIINNGCRYTRDTLKISAHRQDDWLIITIADNGDGYPAEMLMRDSSSHSGIDFHTGSTGLGFYFSAQIAKLHHHRDKTGYIKIDNEGLAQGGRFTLYLP